MTVEVAAQDVPVTAPRPLAARASLALKLAHVAYECSYVQKQGTNNFHRYKYATAADVLAKVNASLAAHGLCATTRPEIVSVDEVKTAKGNAERLVTVRVDVTIHDGETGEKLTTSGLGSGQDVGDKAVMKAQTAAQKYAWMLALNISTGEDPEEDVRVDREMAGGAGPAPVARIYNAPSQQSAPAQTSAPAARAAPTDPAVEWKTYLAGATGKQLVADARAVLEVAGPLAATVRQLYVARWGGLLRAYDDATFTAVLPRMNNLPEELRNAGEWDAIAPEIAARLERINAAAGQAA
jgi:hypothetical protein